MSSVTHSKIPPPRCFHLAGIDPAENMKKHPFK
nr:hypothetical protein [Enterobacter hormaechei subsp. steigerwaltii]